MVVIASDGGQGRIPGARRLWTRLLLAPVPALRMSNRFGISRPGGGVIASAPPGERDRACKGGLNVASAVTRCYPHLTRESLCLAIWPLASDAITATSPTDPITRAADSHCEFVASLSRDHGRERRRVATEEDNIDLH